MVKGLESRRRVLAAITDLSERHGESPTVRQIADEVGLSTSVVHGHLRSLVDAGDVIAPTRKGAGWRATAR